MEIKIHVPLKADLVFKGFEINVANKGDSWLREQLGQYSNKSGVYVHHCNGEILYIGKTTSGQWGNFGERLRREFQETSSQNSNLFNVLKSQNGTIKSVFFDLDDIDMMVNSGNIQLSKERKALILEQVLIGVFEPVGNRM